MAGQNNFLQWNPSQENQETDSQYAADPQRVGGAIDGQPWPAISANKALYQATTGITALMMMMANKGFNVLDSNISTLASVLAAIQTTADSRTPYQVVSYSSTVTLNCAQYSGFEIYVNGPITVLTTGQTPGQVIPILFIMDTVGGHNISIPVVADSEVYYDASPSAHTTMLFQVISNNSLRALAPCMSGTGLNGTPIGQDVPSPGTFSTLASTALANLASLSVIGNALINGSLTANNYLASPVLVANRGTAGSDGFVFTGDQQTGVTSPSIGTGQLQAGNVAAAQWNSANVAILVSLSVAAFFAANGGGSLAGNFSGNPVFTGTPSTSVPGNSDNSARIPTTSWVQTLLAAATTAIEAYAASQASSQASSAQSNAISTSETYTNNYVSGGTQSLASPGYIKFPTFMGNFILQWGTTGNLGGGSTNVNFPISFPSQIFGVQVSALSGGSADFMYVTSTSTSGCTIHDDGGGASAMWFAYGH